MKGFPSIKNILNTNSGKKWQKDNILLHCYICLSINTINFLLKKTDYKLKLNMKHENHFFSTEMHMYITKKFKV